jgi:hypothetical protein
MRLVMATVLCALTALFSYAASGSALGSFIGSTALLTLIVPPVVLMRDPLREQVATAGLCVVGVVSIWLIALTSGVSMAQWARCSCVLMAYSFTLAGLAVVLRRVRFDLSLTSAVTVVLGLAWLGWPVWLSHHLNSSAAGVLVAAHPLFAINGVLRHLGAWTHQGLMYQVSAMGQDVPYVLPTSVLPCVLLHGAIAAVLLALAAWRRASRQRDAPAGEVVGASAG